MTPPRIVVMGVSGCGKSTVGRGLAASLGLPFVEGDDLHPAANVARMVAGLPLTDEDRAGWLDAIAARLAEPAAHRHGVVVACSALKRRYRDRLRTGAPDLRLVYLHGDGGLVASRLASRQGHYMPASLLPSQIAILQPPEPDERALVGDIRQPPDFLVRDLARRLQDHPA
jgi:gluconokinase